MWKRIRAYWHNADADTHRKRIVSLICVGAFLALLAILFATVGRQIIRFVSDSEGFRAWIDARGVWGKLIYIGIVMLQIIVAIIPGEPIELVAGYAFGAWQGLLLTELGIMLSSCIIFLFVKKYGMRAVEAFIPREKIESLRFLQDEKKRNIIIFLIFFIPGTPKDVLTYFVGLTPMTVGQWLLITSVARIPSVLSSTLAGAAVGDSNYLTALLIYGITAIISLAGAAFYRKIEKRGKK